MTKHFYIVHIFHLKVKTNQTTFVKMKNPFIKELETYILSKTNQAQAIVNLKINLHQEWREEP